MSWDRGFDDIGDYWEAQDRAQGRAAIGVIVAGAAIMMVYGISTLYQNHERKIDERSHVAPLTHQVECAPTTPSRSIMLRKGDRYIRLVCK